jgi:hypothetical protein
LRNGEFYAKQHGAIHAALLKNPSMMLVQDALTGVQSQAVLGIERVRWLGVGEDCGMPSLGGDLKHRAFSPPLRADG